MSLVLKIQRFFFMNSMRKRRFFYHDFSQAIGDGVAPVDRIRKMAKRARKNGKSIATLYESWLARMKRVSFTESLHRSVPPYEVMVLKSAEVDGRLGEAMTFLARSLEILGKIKSAYIMSMLSPCLSFAVITGMIGVNALMVGPMNLDIVPLHLWPESAKSLYMFSSTVVKYWYFAISGIIVFLFIIMWSRGNWYGKIRVKVDAIPMLPWKSYRDRQADAFLISLAMMLQSNKMGIKEALTDMKQFASPWMKWHLDAMLNRLRLTPDEPARALRTGLFSQDIMDRIEDFSERSNFEDGLKRMALDNGDYAVEKANASAVMTSFVAIGLSAAFMLFFSMAQIEFGMSIESIIKMKG